MIINCAYCGKPFKAKPSAVKKGKKYCCKACYDAAQFKGEIKRCAWCGKEIKVSPSLIREHNFCSNECRLKWTSEFVKKDLNIKGHSAGHKAPHLTALNKERNPKLAIEKNPDKRGKYNKYQYRKIMEGVLGRKLKPTEDVHHINGIHDDNRPGNLMVIDHREHMKLHWKLEKQKEVVQP